MDKGIPVDVIYTDFQKAFDSVNHKILKKKLNDLGFSDNLCDFFWSYLTGRVQYVHYRGRTSEKFTCPSGVPQGSNLGPLLFLLFVNDLPTVIQDSEILMYADDVKMYRSIEHHTDFESLQRDLDRLACWSIENRLSLNVGKCTYTTFTRKKQYTKYEYAITGKKLTRSDKVRDLGILLDRELTFHDHIESVMSRAKRMAYFIVRNSANFKKTSTLKILYFSFVRSLLEFGVLVWFPHTVTVTEKIEKIQNRFLKYVYFKDFEYYPDSENIPYDELLVGYEIESLKKRREKTAIMFLYDLIHGNINDEKLLQEINIWVPKTQSRYKKYFSLKKCRTTKMEFSPLNNLMKIANNFLTECTQADIYSMPRSTFKWLGAGWGAVG